MYSQMKENSYNTALQTNQVLVTVIILLPYYSGITFTTIYIKSGEGGRDKKVRKQKERKKERTQDLKEITSLIIKHHHHHHNLCRIRFNCLPSKCNWSLHLLIGQPGSFHPSDLYSRAYFGFQLVFILKTCNQFFR